MKLKTTFLPVLLGVSLLAGCSDSDVAEVNSWMDQVKKDTKVNVTPISEPKTFVPFAYGVREEVSPFDQNKLLAELARAAASSNSQFRPDLNRRKEFLESFPIDSMTMIGTINKAGAHYGLIQIDRNVYQVRVGARLGQNFGQITAVADAAISIKETVQDAGGDWVERLSKLELQEGKETKK
jgi:type IV pilus assembly protein PilP